MKMILLLLFAGIAGIFSLAFWLTHREENLPRADFAIMPADSPTMIQSKMSFVYKDPNGSYTVNVSDVAFDPETQEAVLGGTIGESTDPNLPTGARTLIFIQGTQDFWQEFPSIQTSSIGKSTLN